MKSCTPVTPAKAGVQLRYWIPAFAGMTAFYVVLSAPLRAENPEQRIERLQHSIDGASELGNFARVQGLRLQLADLFEAQGENAAAARQIELVLASRPAKSERVRLFVRLGRLRSRVQDYSGAIASFQDALHDEPKDWEANVELGRAYSHAELNSLAIKVYQRCIKMRPHERAPYQEIGDVYQRLGYLAKALDAYEKALQIAPAAEIYLAMADCYVRQGEMAEATAVLQKAKASLPRVDYDIRLGDIYRKRGDLERATGAWEEALKSDDSRDDVRMKLLLAYSQTGHVAPADRLLKRLASKYPDSPLVHFVKAWVLYDRGDREGARREALVVRGLAPTELVQHYNDRLIALIHP